MAIFISLLLLLICVGFYTLLERKVLGYIMNRNGPNKPSLAGILTPFSDALNLISKFYLSPSLSLPMTVFSGIALMLLLPLILWSQVWVSSSVLSPLYPLLLILFLASLSVFGTLGIGWGSNSTYSELGATRSVAQCISYEVVFSLFLFTSFWLSSFMVFGPKILAAGCFSPLSILILFLLCLAESNRSPFDFVEGESELVSGFNVETSSLPFLLIFLSEYLSIIFFSTFLSWILWVSSFPILQLGSLFFGFSYIWARGTLPRLRYDSLMFLCWKSLLPLTLCYLLLSLLFYSSPFALNAIFSWWMIYPFIIVFYFFTMIFLLLFLFFCLLAGAPSSAEQCSSYECGFEPLSRHRPRLCMQFFLLCILFLIFDLEIGFVVPSLCRRTILFSFLLLLLIGLLIEYYYGGLDWLC